METYSLFPVLLFASYNTHVDDVGTIQERLEPALAYMIEHHDELIRSYYIRVRAEQRRGRTTYDRNHPGMRAILQQRYRKAHPMESRIRVHRYNSRKRSLPHERITAEDVRAMLDAQSGLCFYCGDELGAFVLEHMMPVSRGGGTLKANLCLACRTCNSRKHDRTVEEFQAYLAHR